MGAKLKVFWCMLFPYLFVLGGFAVATIFNVGGIQNQQWYLWTVGALLAIGLYSSTYGISVQDARKHFGLIVRAITIGVFLKAFIIGVVLSLVLRDPFGLVLGVAVAQIDPLATAGLTKGNRMSKPAKAIIRAWSSFDDPMTVILSLYVPVIIAMFAGTTWEPAAGTMQAAGLGGYFFETGINLLFAAGIFVLWQLMRRHSKTANYVVVVFISLGMYGLVVGALSLAVYYFWMLGMAVLGLFMRPPIDRAVDAGLNWALSVAALLLGILLVDGVALWHGLVLGVMAYSSQIIVGMLLTRRLPHRDRLCIAFAQQNGITAIILALLFESYYPGTVAIVAPAVVCINVIYAVANRLLDMHLARDYSKLRPLPHLEKLKAHVHKI